MSTPIFPVMDNMYMDTFFFSVPLRLVWDNFQRFMGERDPDPDSSVDFQVPVMDIAEEPTTSGYAIGSIYDYMGLPTGIPELEHSALFTRAYNLIWNEWFRDQNLQDSVTVDKDDGDDDAADYVLLKTWQAPRLLHISLTLDTKIRRPGINTLRDIGTNST